MEWTKDFHVSRWRASTRWPSRGQTVEAAPALPGFLDPPALQPSPFFQAIEERVQ